MIRDKGIDPQVLDMILGVVDSLASSGVKEIDPAHVAAILREIPEEKLDHPHEISEAEVRRCIQALVMNSSTRVQIRSLGREIVIVPRGASFTPVELQHWNPRPGDSNLTIGLGQN